MADVTLPALDAGSAVRPRLFLREDDGAGGYKYTAYTAEHPTQRAALLTALGALGSQTTLAAVLAKLIAAPATEAKQDATNTLLAAQTGYLDGVEGLLTTIGGYLAATLAVALPRVNATAWTDGTTAQDMRAYKDVDIEVIGTPTAALSIQRSMISTGSYPTAKLYDAQQQGLTSITSPGTYSVQGFGLYKFTGTLGSATVYIRGSN